MSEVDAFVCVVLQVWGDGALDEAWSEGPLPVPYPLAVTADRPGAPTQADKSARAGYFASRIVDALYATDESRQSGRWHAAIAPVEAHGITLHGWECLLVRDASAPPGGYLVAHLQLPAKPLGALAAFARREEPERSWLEEQIPHGVKVVPRSPVGLVSHLFFRGAQLPEPDTRARVLEATSSWDVVDRWLWFLGTGVEADSYLPDPQAPRPGTVVHLSADWRALALRTGVAYCALTPSDEGPHELLRTYVRSIHLDGFLLCQLQADAAQRLADELGQTRVTGMTVEAAMGLEEHLLGLRGHLWWRHVSGRGSQVDQVVRALQDERDLPELYQQLVGELADTGRFIQLRQTLADQERDRRLSQLVALVSAAFVTPSVFLAAAALVPDPSRRLQIAFWVGSVVLAIVTWFAVRFWLKRSDGR